MKLFTSSQVVANKYKQEEADQKRIGVISEELKRKRQQLEALEREFNETLERQRTQLEQDKTDALTALKLLRDEVKTLENRKAQALIPLTEREKELERWSSTLNRREEVLDNKSDHLDEIAETLQVRLTEVADREKQADLTAQHQANAQQGIDLQREQIKNQSSQFNELMLASAERLSTREAELLKRETIAKMREKTLSDKQLELNKIEEGFAARERSIQDKYETLERTLKRNNIKTI